MKTVKVRFKKIKGTIETSIIRLDDKKLSIDSSGNASQTLAPGDHCLGYFLEGIKGSSFEIAITAPHEAVWKPSTKTMARKVKVGGKQFRVNNE